MIPSKRTACRISGEPLIELFSLGDLYVSDFLPSDASPRTEPVPLTLSLAPQSGLVQLAHTASMDDMYSEYWYRSGTNQTMTRELQGIAERAQLLMRPSAGDIFLDIGCNDGTLLSFVDPALTRIGFDPAKNTYLEEQSRKHANKVIVDYFKADLFLSATGGKKASIITSIAMFYDLEDPNEFVEDIKASLDDNGLWIIQMSYLPLMLQQLAFDNICHEHLEYYSLHSLKYLLDKHGLDIVDCELNDVNGGSFRIYIRKKDANQLQFGTAPHRDVARMRVASILSHEVTLNLTDPQTYLDFYANALALKEQTMTFIKNEKDAGKTIWGYGASTKGNTLLQWFGIDHTLIDAIAERSEIKYGKKTVGTNIPIKSEADMRAAAPDYLLVLPWHFIHEFTQREKTFLQQGGKFIVPCPRFEVIGA